MSRRSRYDRSFWEALLKDFESSGQTQSAFAGQRGVERNAFCYWVQKLRRERASGVRGSEGAKDVRLVPVNLVQHGPGTSSPSAAPLEAVLPGGLMLRFAGGTDAAYVATVLAEVWARC